MVLSVDKKTNFCFTFPYKKGGGDLLSWLLINLIKRSEKNPTDIYKQALPQSHDFTLIL